MKHQHQKPTILIVDDDDRILYAFNSMFSRQGFRTVEARDGVEALEKVAGEHPSVVIMDITMPKLDGLTALRKIKARNRSIPVIIITGFGTMDTAIKATQLGAFEYITKPIDVDRIRDITLRALASTSERLAQPSERALLDANVVEPYEIVGTTGKMQEVYKFIGAVSVTPNHTTVLIVGETGTGKELVARAIHQHGANSGGPFVPINCIVLPESLLESELFGHEKGAFTGAFARKLGKFEIAHHGTIFLDEIGNLSPSLQQKLLRVLQEREFERVGGMETIRVSARFIAATNRDLQAEVKKGNFREDLFFRLNVATIHLPPLRDHTEDIPLLAEYFLVKYNTELKKSIREFSEDAISALKTYSYPGNVRELENLVERAVMLTRTELITRDVLPETLLASSEQDLKRPLNSPTFRKSRAYIIDQFEQQFLQELLILHRGNVTAAARASKMTRQNLQRLMAKHGIRANRFRT
ncbi:MAG: sigma-54-dependent transcriptional regulator [Bacteroidota bacterium]